MHLHTRCKMQPKDAYIRVNYLDLSQVRVNHLDLPKRGVKFDLLSIPNTLLQSASRYNAGGTSASWDIKDHVTQPLKKRALSRLGKKSATMSEVGQYATLISLFLMRSAIKKYRTLMCRVRFPLDQQPWFSSLMALALS